MPDQPANAPTQRIIPHDVPAECADVYIEERFDSSPRMRRLDVYEKNFARHAFELAGASNAAVLDVPCGSGRFSEIFRSAKTLHIADLSGEMLRVARQRLADAPNVHPMQADVRHLPLPDGAVDLAFCMRLFHHMKTDDIRLAALKDLARVSRRFVALSFYNRDSLRYWSRKLLGKKQRGNYISRAHLHELARSVGLTPAPKQPQRLSLVEQQTLVVLVKSN